MDPWSLRPRGRRLPLFGVFGSHCLGAAAPIVWGMRIPLSGGCDFEVAPSESAEAATSKSRPPTLSGMLRPIQYKDVGAPPL